MYTPGIVEVLKEARQRRNERLRVMKEQQRRVSKVLVCLNQALLDETIA